jgi:hypothetical protein
MVGASVLFAGIHWLKSWENDQLVNLVFCFIVVLLDLSGQILG